MEYNNYTSSPSASPSNTIFSNGPYFDNTSDSSSPNSPHLNHIMYNNTLPYDAYQYRATPASCYPAQSQMKIPVALTSSTLDEKERRRKRSESTKSQEKETIPNMHLQRRRAQNRASQRAFRERKEKHVKGLEHQLEDLHEKHQDLLYSYSKQSDEVVRLNGRIAELAAELQAIRHCPEGSFNDMMIPEKFDKFDAFSSTDLAYHQGDAYYDKGSMELNSDFALHSFEDCL